MIGPISLQKKNTILVRGFNPSQKYQSKWVHLPKVGGEHIKVFELPPSRVVTTKMMGLGKGDSFEIWPFWVSMLDFWGALTTIIINHLPTTKTNHPATNTATRHSILWPIARLPQGRTELASVDQMFLRVDDATAIHIRTPLGESSRKVNPFRDKVGRWNLKSWWFGSDDFPDFNWVIFSFHVNLPGCTEPPRVNFCSEILGGCVWGS